MRTFSLVATAVSLSLALLTAAPAVAADAQDQTQQAPAQTGDQQTPYGGVPLSGDQLSKEYQNLSPQTRSALANQLKSRGLDGLSQMNEADARTAFANLPP